jgi:hypothetical protein
MDIISLILKIKKFGLENVFKRFYSKYPAQVVDIKDPENRGRVKLKVPDILDDTELAEWAEPILISAGKDKSASGATNGSFGVFYPPKVDDFVWVQFRMGDLRNPLYFGGWWAENEKPAILSDEYVNAIFISRYGHKIILDETPDNAKITLETDKKFKVEIDEGSDKILIQTGLTENKIELSDQAGSEYILIEDKNGAQLKFDLSSKKITLVSTGAGDITIDTILNVESGSKAILKQPQIAIGNGSDELLKAIFDMMTSLGTVQILTPVGPAAPMTASSQWPQVATQMAKIQGITGTF